MYGGTKHTPDELAAIRTINAYFYRGIRWSPPPGMIARPLRPKAEFCTSLSRSKALLHRPFEVCMVWRHGQPFRMGAKYTCGYICTNVGLVSTAVSGNVICGTCYNGRPRNVRVVLDRRRQLENVQVTD